MKRRSLLSGLVLAIQVVTLVMLPVTAYADTVDVNMTITTIGVSGSSAYMGFASPPSQACRYGIVYIDLSTDSGKAMYSLAISAKISHASLTRVAYVLQNELASRP